MTDDRAYMGTKVSVEKSVGDIKGLLYKHGCTGFRYTELPEGFVIEFVRPMNDPRLPNKGVVVSLPVRFDFREASTQKQTEQVRRAYYRAAHYWLKTTWEAIDFGLIAFEEAFLADMVVALPEGKQGRVKDILLRPALEQSRGTLLLLDGD